MTSNRRDTSARIDAVVDRLSGVDLPSSTLELLEVAASKVQAATTQQKNKAITTLWWAGKAGKPAEGLSREVIDVLVEEGLVAKTKHKVMRYRLTSKGVERFAKISKKKKELVEKGVRKHAACEQAARAANVATQTKFAVEAAGMLGSPDIASTTLSIPLPKKYASRFPDPVVHNKGHEPHITVLHIGKKDYTEAEMSEIIHRVRAAAKTIPPFRVYVDPNSGLRDFGPSASGEMALWLPARAEPRGEIGRLHRMMRLSLEREGVDVDHKDGFVPHATWAYVSNDIQEDTRRRLDGHVYDRFRDGFWFEVRDVVLSMADGTSKRFPLNPNPKKSIY